MSKKPGTALRFLLCWMLVLSSRIGVAHAANGADRCPTTADEITTDRPDVTDSSVVVPFGSLQAENGIDWTAQHGSSALDGTNTCLRLGVGHCAEFLIDLPNHFTSLNGSQGSGFSNVIVSLKRQLPVPLGFDLSVTVGVGFPSGSGKVTGPGYQTYIQFPWSHSVADGWQVVGMFTMTWLPSQSARNPTFEPTFSLEREFGSSADMFVEYVGDYDHQRPGQLIDGGGSWRFTKTQQLDFHAGFGLNSSSVDHYFGIGYSFRLDGLFRSAAGHSP